MNSLQKRAIAKIIYRDIQAINEKFFSPDLIIELGDNPITVDGEVFQPWQLRDYVEEE